MQWLSRLFNDKASYRIGLFLCGALVMGWLAWIARDDLLTISRNVRPGYFLIAVLLGVVFTIFQGALFAQLMAKNGSNTNFRKLISAFLLSQPGKYIPGKVWPAMMQSLVLRDLSNFTGIAIANVELFAIAMIQMTALGLACLSLHSPFIMLTALFCGLALSTMIVLLPTAAILNRISARLAILLRINACGSHYCLGFLWGTLLLCGIAIICNFAASLWVLFAAGSSITPQQYGPILSSLYLAFATSLLVVPIPAGVGVREAATIGVGLLVAPEISSEVLISIALLTRCWQLLVDALCLGLGAMILALSLSVKK
jgi:hypothetical protein